MRRYSARAEHDLDVAYPLRTSPLAGWLSWILFATCGGAVYGLFQPVAPMARFLPLAVYSGTFTLAWAGLTAILTLRPPSTQAGRMFWEAVTKGVMIGADIACVWTIWAMGPFATSDTMPLLIVIVMGNAPTQILCTPENPNINRLGIVSVVASLVAFMLNRGGVANILVALYLVGFGAMMLVLAGVARRAVDVSLSARRAAEESNVRLQASLSAVSAERDAKTRFIAAASHDLGQPLQAAALFFDQLLRSKSPVQHEAAASGVRKAFESAQQLLSHMLNHLRLEADAVEPQWSMVDLGGAMRRAADQYAPAAREAGVRLRVVACSRVLRLDPSLLDRALGNLVANAIAHSGGSRVLIGVRRHGEAVLGLWVIDDGVGIGPVEAAHVFEDYFQGSESRATTRGGFGLGLSSVRRLARMMDGEASLRPRVHRGAAFCLTFPVSRAESERVVRKAPVVRRAA